MALLLIGGCLLLPTLAEAAWRYRDAQGHLSYTDDWRTIPLELRASAVPPVPPPEPAPVASPEQVAILAVPVPPVEKTASSPTPEIQLAQPLPVAAAVPTPVAHWWQEPWVVFGGIVLAALASLLLVVTLAQRIGSPLFSRLIILVYFIGVCVVCYRMYVDYMVEGYFTMKKQTVQMLEKANRREERIQNVAPEARGTVPR